MDELEALLDEQHGQPPHQTAALTAIQTALRAIGGEMPSFIDASPQEREDIIYQLEQVTAIENVARSRRRALEHAIIRAAITLDAQELRAKDCKVRVEPPKVGYDTKALSMRQQLLALVPEGDLSRAEVDEAIPEVIDAKPDHRKLNALLKRGGRVQAAIEANRVKPEPNMDNARVRINRRGGNP